MQEESRVMSSPFDKVSSVMGLNRCVRGIEYFFLAFEYRLAPQNRFVSRSRLLLAVRVITTQRRSP